MSVDNLSQDFLSVLIENENQATTTQIRSRTGMSRGQVNHRFKKLEDKDWIDIDRAEEGRGNREPPKIAVLTDKGEKAIKNGEVGKRVLEDNKDDSAEVRVSKQQIEEFYEEIDGVKNRLNVVVENMGSTNSTEENTEKNEISVDRIESIEKDLSRLKNTVEMLNDAIIKNDKEESNSSEQEEQNSQRQDAINELRDEQEYLREWMDVAQKHMVAFRLYVQDEGDDFNKYLDMAEEKSNNSQS